MSLIRAAGKCVFAAGDLLKAPPEGPRLLIYHRVGTSHGYQMEVTLENFRKQLSWLGSNRQIVDLDTAWRSWGDPGSRYLTALTFDDGYRDLFTTAYPLMLDVACPFVLYLSTSFIAGSDDGAVSPPDALTWSDIEEMLASGLMTLGAHTHTHPDLRSLSEEEVEDELGTSDDIIERRLGLKPRHFAYPYGFWSESADRPVRRRYATAVLGGTPDPPAKPDPHLLHRYPVQLSDGFVFFKARLNRGFRMEESLRRRIKRYTGP